MSDAWVRAVVAATIIAVVVALVVRRPQHEAYVRFTPSHDELLRRKVAVVRSMPSRKDPATVYFVVDSQNRLLKNPKLPYEGVNFRAVLHEFQERFGSRVVEATTARKKINKVQVVYDAQTQEVTKLLVPRQWSMPPRQLRLKPVRVLLNPRPGVPVTSKTLVLLTGADNRVTSATVRE